MQTARIQKHTPSAGRRPLFDITQDTLKLTALITMFIDHIGAGILEHLLADGLITDGALRLWIYDINTVLRAIGRISFPLYACLLVQGAIHTGSILRYALRLFLFALISELPFDLLFFGTPTLLHQNIFWTLLIALLLIAVLRALPGVCPEIHSLRLRPLFHILTALLATAAAMRISVLLHTDYSWKGILLIVLIYALRTRPVLRDTIAPTAFLISEYAALTASGTLPALALDTVLRHLLVYVSFLLNHTAAPTRRRTSHPYLPYAFYPLHLLVLLLIRTFIYGILS